ERTLKWVKRHPAVTSWAAAFLLSLLVGVPWLIYLWLQANAHAREADQQRAQAVTNLQTAHEERDRAEKNLDKGRQSVDDFFLKVERRLGELPGAQPLRQEMLQTARTYYADFIQQAQDNPRMQTSLAAAHARLAYLIAETGSKTEALQAYQEALT